MLTVSALAPSHLVPAATQLLTFSTERKKKKTNSILRNKHHEASHYRRLVRLFIF